MRKLLRLMRQSVDGRTTMRRILRRPVVVVAIIVGVLVGAAAPSWGWFSIWTSRTQCNDKGYGLCLWNQDQGVTSGNGVYLNSNANTQGAIRYNVTNNWGGCNGSDRVQSTAAGDSTNCPFDDPTVDALLAGAPIVAIQSNYRTSLCIGAVTYWTGASVFDHANALWHSCPGGSGDSTYTYWVADQDLVDCGHCYWYINVRGSNELHTNGYGHQVLYLHSDGHQGDLADLVPHAADFSQPGAWTWCPSRSNSNDCG